MFRASIVVSVKDRWALGTRHEDDKGIGMKGMEYPTPRKNSFSKQSNFLIISDIMKSIDMCLKCASTSSANGFSPFIFTCFELFKAICELGTAEDGLVVYGKRNVTGLVSTGQRNFCVLVMIRIALTLQVESQWNIWIFIAKQPTNGLNNVWSLSTEPIKITTH